VLVLKKGQDGNLTKPFNLEEVLLRLQKLMDKNKKLLKQYSDLNEEKLFSYVTTNCTSTTQKGTENYKPIAKFLGSNVWEIYNNNYKTVNFLTLKVELVENNWNKRDDGTITGKLITYADCEVRATLEFFSEKTQELKNEEEGLAIINYYPVNEPTDQIKLKAENGVYLIPIKLNNTITIDFVIDLGASDVSISPDIFWVLERAGKIQESDFIGSQTYHFADGSSAKSSVFNIKTIQIGNKVLKNVRASISNSLSAPLLLGQSALKKLDSYRIDNTQKLLIIE